MFWPCTPPTLSYVCPKRLMRRNNAPGASVTSAGQSVTRENKLQMWAE